MQIALVSHSRDPALSPVFLERVANVLEVQLYRDYAPFWQSAGVPVKAYTAEADAPPDASLLAVFDDSDQAGALGYHATTPNGTPYGRGFLTPIKESGGTLHEGANSLSCTLSHEVLEMVGDPYASWWADVDAHVQECLELCDRTEADSYEIEGVAVSNFLGPRAFRDGPGPYDLMRLLSSPWEIRPGGYVIRRKGGRVYNLWGREYPEHKRVSKAHPASRTSRRLLASVA